MPEKEVGWVTGLGTLDFSPVNVCSFLLGIYYVQRYSSMPLGKMVTQLPTELS